MWRMRFENNDKVKRFWRHLQEFQQNKVPRVNFDYLIADGANKTDVFGNVANLKKYL